MADKGKSIGRQVRDELGSFKTGAEQVNSALRAQMSDFRNEFSEATAETFHGQNIDFYAMYDDEGGDESFGPPLWLLTFTDIMALMLTFFVLLYSMAVPDENQWEEMIRSVEEGINIQKTLQNFSGQMQDISIEKISSDRALDLNYLQNVLQRQFAEEESLQSALLLSGAGRLIISLPTDVVFAAGDTEVSLEAKRALMALGDLFYRIKNRIEVVGHSDPTPISGGLYQDNWALSLARATSIASLLRQSGYKRDVVVRGVSSGRFDELSEDIPAMMRQKMARRVDIVIMQDSGNPLAFTPVSIRR